MRLYSSGSADRDYIDCGQTDSLCSVRLQAVPNRQLSRIACHGVRLQAVSDSLTAIRG